MSTSKTPKKPAYTRRGTYRIFDKSELNQISDTQLGEYKSLYDQFMISLNYLERKISSISSKTDRDKLRSVLALKDQNKDKIKEVIYSIAKKHVDVNFVAEEIAHKFGLVVYLTKDDFSNEKRGHKKCLEISFHRLYRVLLWGWG